MNQTKTKKVYESREQQFMKNCCRECGRMGKIPYSFCYNCFSEARKIIRTKQQEQQ